MSAGLSPSAAAAAAASGAPSSGFGSWGKSNEARPQSASTMAVRQRTGPMPSSTTSSRAAPPSRRPSSTAVPTVG
jgi:hypothetical protein